MATGQLTNLGQKDWFAVSLTANQAYEVTIVGGAGATIGTSDELSGDGTLATSFPNSDLVSPSGGTQSLYFMPSGSGTYYIDVSDPLATVPEDFVVSVATATADFTDNPSSPGTIAVGGSATGQLTNLGQKDWFAVSLTANQAYEVSIVGGAGATIGTSDALSGDGTLAISFPNSELGSPSGGTQSLYFMPSASGTYYIDVSDPYVTVPEDFTVNLATTTADFTDNPSSPGTVAVGGSANGQLTNLGQKDWFAVSLTANQAYEMTIVGGAGATIGTSDELSGDGTLAFSIPNSLNSPSGGTQSMYFMPSGSGTYYIDVSDPFATVPEDFTVNLATVTADFTDNPSSPGTVAVGGSANGQLTNLGQKDWFAVSLTVNQAYEVTIVGGAGATIGTSDALSGDGALAISFPNSELGSPSGGTQSLYFMPATGGTYYIDVSDPYATVPEDFTVSVATATADFTDNPSSPGTVAVGGSANGQLTNLGQKDWFAVSLTANQAYEVTIVGGAGATIGTSDALSGDGALAISFPNSELGSPSGGTQSLYFMPATGGTYYIDVSDPYATVPEDFTVSVATATADFTDNPSSPGTAAIVCFCRGTLILTEKGEIPVEALAVGDRVATLSGAFKPITWIGFGRDLVTRRNSLARPVIVLRGALADNVPRRDLYLTHGHSLYLDGVLIPVEHLVNHRSILWDDEARIVEYYHVELADHDLVIAEGAPAESYYNAGNRALFQNTRSRSEAGAAQPTCAPVLTGGDAVEGAWAKLFARAGGEIERDTTDDPDLHLIVAGARLDSASVEGGVHTFALAAPPAEGLLLRSRSAVPSLVGLNRHEHRPLGVALRRITFSQPGVLTCLDHDAPAFCEAGCHPPEAGHSWTDGQLTLPAYLFAHLRGAFTLIVHTRKQAMRYSNVSHLAAARTPSDAPDAGRRDRAASIVAA